MKKIISLLLAFLMVFAVLAGCGKSKPSEPSDDTSYEEEYPDDENPGEEENTTTSSSKKSTSSSKVSATTKPSTTTTKPSTTTTKPSTTTIKPSATTTIKPSSSATIKPSSKTEASTVKTSEASSDANIVESASQGQMEGSQTTATGFSYEDYRVVGSEYNRNLFYYNELLFEVADPTVIYISDTTSPEYGYFYAYGTSDQIGCVGFQAWRSRDLTNWEDMGAVYLPDFNNCWAYTNYWAPEIIYDATGMNINGKTYKYFLFFNAEKYDASQDFVSGADRTTTQHLSVLYAEQPNGPFYHPNGIKNKDGKSLSVNAPVFDFSFSNSSVPSGIQCTNVIDASPFIDTDGTKYMYYSGWGATKTGSSQQCIYGVKMKDWFTPDYGTTNVICQTHRMTVGGALIDHEGRNSGAWVNEGPFMIKRNGTYMMTFSIYPYTHVNYQVRLATSSSPLSGFTKIDPYNGGTVIRTHKDWDGVIQSVGHHSFIEVGDELFIAYHTFKDRTSIAAGRALAVDKVLAVKNSAGKNVLFTNGPTYGYQPLPVEVSGYKNIASEATVTAEGVISGDKSYLTDGIVQHHEAVDIGDFGKEVEFKGTANKITFEFPTYKNVRAIMVNLGRKWAYALGKINKVTMTYLSDNGDKQVVVDDMQYDYSKFVSDPKKRVYPGGSAMLEFADLPVKKIEIELRGVSTYDFKITEIQILANVKNTTITPVTDAKLAEKYSYLNAEVPVIKKHDQGEVIGSVKVGSAELHTNFGVDLSHDDGTANGYIKTIGPRDQYSFFKGVSTDTIYFEAKFNVYITTPFMGDKYPKLGLVAKNSAGCTFFYIDAANNYNNKAVGYTQSQYGGGNWDWASTEEVMSAPNIAYKGGSNYTKLAIARTGGTFYFYLNDVKVFESLELRGMSEGSNAGYGFLCFNTGMKVKEYSYILGEEAVNQKIALLAAGSQGGGNTGDGEQSGPVVISENHIASSVTIGKTTKISATTWDTTKNYTTDDANYANRKLTLSSTNSADNYLYLNKNSKRLYAEATFKATGTTANEAWGKFGFLFETEDGNGLLFYVDANTGIGNALCTASQIKGTSVGIVPRSSNNYLWSDSGSKSTAGLYKGTESITLGIYRQNSLIKCLVNGNVVYVTHANINGMINPAIVSFNIGLEVTNYRITNSSTDAMMKELYDASANSEVITELAFGNIDGNPDLVEAGTWTKTINSATNTDGKESVIYCNTICGTNLYFQADMTISGVRNGDKYPKAGLYLRSGTKSVWFYIDAINGGNANDTPFGTNQNVGYVYETVGGDLAGGEAGFKWGTEKTVSVPGISYTNGATTTLGILYTNASIYFVVNGKIITSVHNVSGLTAGVNVGIVSYNCNVSATNCQGVVSDTGLEKVKSDLGIICGDITIDGDVSDWIGTKASYYEAKESAAGTGKGFKVMAVKADKGILVGYSAICDTINENNVDWWLNTNIEAVFYTTGNKQVQVFASLDGQQQNVGLYRFSHTKRASDGKYIVTIEMFISFAEIGYAGTEEFAVGYFAFRPGKSGETEEEGIGINSGSNGVWWCGATSPYGLQFTDASNHYKITANGLVGPKVTVVS